MEKIEIIGVLNGWIVQVGCQTVVFTDASYMCDELERYVENPSKVENEYLEAKKNNTVPMVFIGMDAGNEITMPKRSHSV